MPSAKDIFNYPIILFHHKHKRGKEVMMSNADKSNQSDLNPKEGLAYLEHAFQIQGECASLTRSYIKDKDTEIYATLTKLGSALSLLDRVGSCYWGCKGGDHIAERLIAKTVSFAIATIRLAEFGHYDEALGLARSIGEVANLFSLFKADSQAFINWKSANEQERKTSFGPFQVRKALERNGQTLWIDHTRYKELCEISTHPTPHAAPQNFNSAGRPTMGGIFQPKGLAHSIFELSVQISGIAICASSVVDVDDTVREAVATAGLDLLNSIPGVTLSS